MGVPIDRDSIELSLAPDRFAPQLARRALSDLTDGLEDGLRERGAVVLSELVTNSVRHAGLAGTQRVAVVLRLWPEAIRMEVTDPGYGFEPGDPRPGKTDGSGGWGLWVIDRMTDRWGVDFESSTNFWCEFDRA
jgi:anti-sigma regulatory factor (Ser/Thr protein kinase)